MADENKRPFIKNLDEKIAECGLKATQQEVEAKDLVSEMQRVMPATDEQLKNMTDEQLSKWTKDACQLLRDEAVRDNKIMKFTINTQEPMKGRNGEILKDAQGNVRMQDVSKIITITPAALDTPGRNAVNDGDPNTNTDVTDSKTGKTEQVHADTMSQQAREAAMFKRMLLMRGISMGLNAPKKAVNMLQNMPNRLGAQDAVKDFGR